MPATFDTQLVLGDTREIAFPIDDQETGTFANLDGIQDLEYAITEDLASDTTLIELSLSDANVEITTAGEIQSVEFDQFDSSVSVARILLEPTDTKGLPNQSLQHEAQLTDPDGNVTTVFQGAIETIPTAIDPRQT